MTSRVVILVIWDVLVSQMHSYPLIFDSGDWECLNFLA
jgi:hypothetical protein